MMWVIMSLHLFQLGILPFICLVHIITPNTIHYLSPSPSDPCPLSCDQAPLLMSLWQMLCTVQSQKQQQTNYRSLCPPPSSLSFILSLLSLPPICGHRRGWGCKWAKTKKISIFSSIWNWDQRSQLIMEITCGSLVGGWNIHFENFFSTSKYCYIIDYWLAANYYYGNGKHPDNSSHTVHHLFLFTLLLQNRIINS